MIRSVHTLNRLEHGVIVALVSGLIEDEEPPLLRALLFGSKARGDDDPRSDVDVLLLFDIPTAAREEVAVHVGDRARHLARRSGIVVEPWVVPVDDLREGSRTPMLIDALADSVPLWPRWAPPLRLPFTPADARFCADCLLDWVDQGGAVAREALRRGRPHEAAARIRDDITRLATAALLLQGETRHRRRGSLRRFEERFVATRQVSPAVLPALAWAANAFPPDGGRGEHRPPATREAVATVHLGYELAGIMRWATPLEPASTPISASPLLAPLRWAGGAPPRYGRVPGAAP